MAGKFISFEGGEGSGKSTQLKMLSAAFSKAALSFISTREPGGSVGAEKIRSLLVSGEVDSWDSVTETLLFNAARSDHLNKLVLPALAEGKTVISDRFLDSTMVYQGIGKGLGEGYIKALHQIVFGNFRPDLTIILDIEPEQGLRRAATRADGEDRFEKLDISFHRKIRAGFLNIAKAELERCAVLDATLQPEELHFKVLEIIKARIGISLC